MTIEILSEAEFLNNEEDVRIVRVSAQYAYDIHELFANIEPTRVRVRRTSTNAKPRIWTFSAQEMDDLCEAWLEFKADRTAALIAEEERKESILTQAYALAASVDGVKIEESDDLNGYGDTHGWRVFVPDDANVRSHGYVSPDGVLEGVKEIIAEWGAQLQRNREQLHEREKLIQEGDERKWLVSGLQYNREKQAKYGHVLEQIENMRAALEVA